MNHLNRISTKKFNLFSIMFVVYACVMFCLNGDADNVKYVYIAWFAIMGLAVFKMLNNLRMVTLGGESITLLAYAFYCYISMLWAWDASLVSLRGTTVLIMVVFTICMVIYFTDSRNVNLILFAITVAGIVLSIYAIITYGGLSAYFEAASLEGSRLDGGIDNANTIGMSCAYSVILLFYFAFYKKKKICYPAMILPFIIAMGSGSRKALLSIVIGVFFLLYLSQNDRRGTGVKLVKLFVIFAAAFGVFLLVLQLPIMETVKERMDGLFSVLKGEGGESSAEARMSMLRVGWEQFKQTPFFGIGLGNAELVSARKLGVRTYLHNDFIEQLVNLGIIGFSIYYGLLIDLLIKHIKLLKTRNPETIASFSMLMVFLVNSYGSVTYFSKTSYLFMVLWISVVSIYNNHINGRGAS